MWLPKGEGAGSGMDWESGVGRYTVLHLEWISKEVLLYDTGNYVQYSEINHNGKNIKKNGEFLGGLAD